MGRYTRDVVGVWRSSVARLLWEQEASSSSLDTPTTFDSHEGFQIHPSLVAMSIGNVRMGLPYASLRT